MAGLDEERLGVSVEVITVSGVVEGHVSISYKMDRNWALRDMESIVQSFVSLGTLLIRIEELVNRRPDVKKVPRSEEFFVRANTKPVEFFMNALFSL